MAKFVWIKPGTKLQYVTIIQNDPGVPAGYLLSNTSDGSGQFADGVTDQNMQTQVAGLWSGGFSGYNAQGGTGYDGTSDQSHTNGHLGGN